MTVYFLNAAWYLYVRPGHFGGKIIFICTDVLDEIRILPNGSIAIPLGRAAGAGP